MITYFDEKEMAMTDLTALSSNKARYGIGQFNDISNLGSKNLGKSQVFDKYANRIVPILGNDTKGILKQWLSWMWLSTDRIPRRLRCPSNGRERAPVVSSTWDPGPRSASAQG